MVRLRLGIVLLLAATTAARAADPRPTLDVRVDRVEKELRAVQRKVFPTGAPAFSEPEIAPQSAAQPAGQPAGSPLADLTARVDALERTVSQLTGQIEQDEHRLTLLSEQSAQDRHDFDERLKRVEAAAPPPPAAPAPKMQDEAIPAPLPRATLGAPRVSTPPPAKLVPARPRADDAAATAPASTGDPAEDAYLAAYRLWADKRYTEAEAALKAFVARYPKHKRTSYAQNLLGRAYLDDNHPATAAEAFAANYQTNPRGDRAPESLYYLGQALMQLKKPADACRVYDELDSAYGDKLPDTLKARAAAARRDAKCK